jgi:hypothetical protein
MDDRIKTAFSSAQDIIKQLITIATAVVGAVVTFSGSGAGAVLNFKASGWPVPLSLGILVLSIGCGLLALMNVVGAIGNMKIQDPTPYQPGIRIFVMGQFFLFVFGIFLLALCAPHWKLFA